jgi:TPR repeat protein
MNTRRIFVAVAMAAVVFGTCLVFGQEAVDVQPQQPQRVDPEQAFILMAGEAERGNGNAMLTLGSMYERGLGTSKNYTKALEWYSRAGGVGMAEGYYNAGVCYEIGMGATGDLVKAFENFERSAELKLPQGLYKLAGLYFTGSGVAKNEPWGVELLGRAAAMGHPDAANDLGVIAFEGRYGQAKDANKAFEWFIRSAEMGNGEAMKNLAVFYRDGIGGRSVDHRQELKWYALAKLAGYPAEAMNPVIDKVRSGLTEEDIQKAEEEARVWVEAFQERQRQGAQP